MTFRHRSRVHIFAEQTVLPDTGSIRGRFYLFKGLRRGRTYYEFTKLATNTERQVT